MNIDDREEKVKQTSDIGRSFEYKNVMRSLAEICDTFKLKKVFYFRQFDDCAMRTCDSICIVI